MYFYTINSISKFSWRQKELNLNFTVCKRYPKPTNISIKKIPQKNWSKQEWNYITFFCSENENGLIQLMPLSYDLFYDVMQYSWSKKENGYLCHLQQRVHHHWHDNCQKCKVRKIVGNIIEFTALRNLWMCLN